MRVVGLMLTVSLSFLVFFDAAFAQRAPIEQTEMYRNFVDPLVPDAKDTLDTSKGGAAIARNNTSGNRTRDVSGLLAGSLPTYLVGESQQQQQAAQEQARTTGFVFMPPAQAGQEIVNSTAKVNNIKEMVEKAALTQQLITIAMTDPAVYSGAVGSDSMGTAAVGNTALTNINLQQQMAQMDRWKRFNFMETINGCLNRHVSAGGGAAGGGAAGGSGGGGKGYMQAWLFCLGDSMQFAENTAVDQANSGAANLSNPEQDHSDHDQQTSASDSTSTATQVSVVDNVYNQRIENDKTGFWKKAKEEYIKYFGDFVANYSGAESLTGTQRDQTAGSTYVSFSIPEQRVYPTVDYNKLHNDSVKAHYEAFRSIFKLVCKLRREAQGYNGIQVNWQWAEENMEFAMTHPTIKQHIKQLSTKDFTPPIAFFEAIYDSFGIDAEAAAGDGSCQYFSQHSRIRDITPDNKYFSQLQIMFWYSEHVTEMKFFDFFIQTSRRILDAVNSENDPWGMELNYWIKRTAGLGEGETLLDRRTYVKDEKLRPLVRTIVENNKHLVGNGGRAFLDSFAKGAGGMQKVEGSS